MRRMLVVRLVLVYSCFSGFAAWAALARAEEPDLLAGAAAVDISPTQYPVIVNGMFTERSADRAHDPLHARSLVLASGDTKLAIVVVDSCGIMREYLDEAKVLASQATGILPERMLISATHTHSAPSAWPVLGSRVDMSYVPHLIRQIARSIELANENLAPARVGWGVVENHDDDFCRRWITRPDRMLEDPFGERTVRAMMHPGFQNPNFIGPSGPIDPDLTVLSVQTTAGRPIAVLANYSMHYFGTPLLSADYFGKFAEEVQRRLSADSDGPAVVAIMSQGTSGDSMWRDYSRAAHDRKFEEFAAGMVDRALKLYDTLEYQERLPLAMLETKLTLGRRVPSAERLARSEEKIAQIGDRLPQDRPEVYALEQRYLNAEPRRELKLQVIRLGEFGIAAWPNEVFNLSGLKLKAASPLPTLINIELANGTEGYIPPPEQHLLGGYTTWPARSAGLETQAEPKIVERLTTMLEQISGRSRRTPEPATGKYPALVESARPYAYWRMDDFSLPRALDAVHARHADYQGGVALFLEGVRGGGWETSNRGNRAAHFAGGSLATKLPKLGEEYSVELWAWNGLPTDARPVAGMLVARTTADGKASERLGIAGAGEQGGRLMYWSAAAGAEPVYGKTPLALKQWHHVALVHDKQGTRIYLDGAPTPEIDVPNAPTAAGARLTIAGADAEEQRAFTFEGKLDEIAVYARVLKPEEIAARVATAAKK